MVSISTLPPQPAGVPSLSTDAVRGMHTAGLAFTPELKISPGVLRTLNIPENQSIGEFCAERFPNICNACGDPDRAARLMGHHLASLLAETGDKPHPDGAQGKFEIVTRLTIALCATLTDDVLATAQRASSQLLQHFGRDTDSLGTTELDRILNVLGLPYHRATHPDGRMGHAQEMRSDVGHFFNRLTYEGLASTLAYCHDHVQIMDKRGMGIGNGTHWGLNEIATAAGLATLADAAGVDVEGQRALRSVAGAVIPAGTAFGLIPNAGADGRTPGLGTTIEGMLRSGALAHGLSESAREVVAMAYVMAICDTRRHNLAGLARPTQAIIQAKAPDVFELLKRCANNDVTFRTTFFENGRLNERGLALCSKLSSTVRVFEEFEPCTFSARSFEGGKANNPLSLSMLPGMLTEDERRRSTLQIIADNGSFGAADVLRDVECISKSFSHPALDNIRRSPPLFEDSRQTFSDAFKLFSKVLESELAASTLNLDQVLDQMRAMGGSVPPARDHAQGHDHDATRSVGHAEAQMQRAVTHHRVAGIEIQARRGESHDIEQAWPYSRSV